MTRHRLQEGIATVTLTLFLLLEAPSLAWVHPIHRSARQRRHAAATAPSTCAFRNAVSAQRPRHVLHDAAHGVDASPPTPRQFRQKHAHTLALLTMPHSASARIANEAILDAAIAVTTGRLSVVLRTNTGGSDSRTGEGRTDVSLTQLRRYVGEIYSMAWDAALGLDEREHDVADEEKEAASAGPITSGGRLLDLIVYPQNMPNTPPEGWIDLRPDLSCICSHDSITGWVTSDLYAGGSGRQYASRQGQGAGGLQAHVDAVNAERGLKGLAPLAALHVDNWPDGAEVTGDPNVVFLEDEDAYGGNPAGQDGAAAGPAFGGLLGGTAVPPASLYASVCVGGTFDGMHYGHRKLLTLAVSSIRPLDGRLLVGVTRDEMLTHKSFAESIPPLAERVAGVLDFLGHVAPGMKNRVRCVPISDEYGPPGQPLGSTVYPGLVNDFDALVLSHETLPTGRKLNAYREEALGLEPLKLLCTQRTEPHGMSSTALRRMRTSKR